MCGSPSVEISQPAAPPAPSTADAVKAYRENLPGMIETQLQYAPQLAGAEYQNFAQYAPLYAGIAQALQGQYAPEQAALNWQMQQQYAPQYAAQQQAIQQEYEPEAYAARQQLGGLMQGDYLQSAPYMQAQDQTMSGLQGLASQNWMTGYQAPDTTDPMLNQVRGMVTQDWMTNYNPAQAPGMMAAKDRLTQDIRGAWADRGLAKSGMSAENEASLMAEFEFPYAMQQEQMRLGELGRRQSLGATLGTYGTDLGMQQEQMQLGEAGRRQTLGQGLAQLGLQSDENALNRYLSEIGRRQNVGLSLAGRYNVPNIANVSTPYTATPQVANPNLMGGYNYGNVQNMLTGNYNTAAGMYNTQYNAYADAAMQNANNWSNLYGNLIGAGGDIGAAKFAASSRILKKEINPVENALEKIKEMKGVNYRWIATDETDGGVIAEELEKVLPDAVAEINGIKHIKPMMVIGYLIEAVKELSLKLEAANG